MIQLTDPDIVKYGIPFKIRHVKTGQILHSHNIAYHSGSREQEVTCFGSRDENDWWMPKGPNGQCRYNCLIAYPVLSNSVIRLEHLQTEKNLHSHCEFQSPDSRQGEITCFGEHGRGDDNDNWRLEIIGKEPGAPWRAEDHFRLIHVGTNYALHSHQGHHTNSHQQEVTGFGHRDDGDLWVVEVNS